MASGSTPTDFAVTDAVHARADAVARASYARLLAILAARDGDIAAAEDCLSDAFAQALSTWPVQGIPERPEAWLLTVARNKRRDEMQSASSRNTERLTDRLSSALNAGSSATSALNASATTLDALNSLNDDEIPDRRLALLFVCAHPAIDASIRTPLMLQTVLGFDAEQIARAFATLPATMAQRLVRAKRRIRDTGIPFIVPDRTQMHARLTPVLEAIYGAYAIVYPLVAGEAERDTLTHEALYLARLLAELLPGESEVQGLAAMLALSLARRPAMQRHGVFVPLDEQDVSLWNRELIAEGLRALARAEEARSAESTLTVRPGRFELEAAIQSAHLARLANQPTDWPRLLELHTQLLTVAPTLGAHVAQIAAIGRAHGARAGLAALEQLATQARTAAAMSRFQPAWATRAHLLAQAGEADAATLAYNKAISLTTDRMMRAWLLSRASLLNSTRGVGLPHVE